MKKIEIVIAVLLIFNNLLYSQETMRIAVLDLKESGVSKIVAVNVSELLRTELFNINFPISNEMRWTVYYRNNSSSNQDV